jgi:hypothetical protein
MKFLKIALVNVIIISYILSDTVIFEGMSNIKIGNIDLNDDHKYTLEIRKDSKTNSIECIEGRGYTGNTSYRIMGVNKFYVNNEDKSKSVVVFTTPAGEISYSPLHQRVDWSHKLVNLKLLFAGSWTIESEQEVTNITATPIKLKSTNNAKELVTTTLLKEFSNVYRTYSDKVEKNKVEIRKNRHTEELSFIEKRGEVSFELLDVCEIFFTPLSKKEENPIKIKFTTVWSDEVYYTLSPDDFKGVQMDTNTEFIKKLFNDHGWDVDDQKKRLTVSYKVVSFMNIEVVNTNWKHLAIRKNPVKRTFEFALKLGKLDLSEQDVVKPWEEVSIIKGYNRTITTHGLHHFVEINDNKTPAIMPIDSEKVKQLQELLNVRNQNGKWTYNRSTKRFYR